MVTKTNAKLFDEWKEKHFSFCWMHIFRHIEIFFIIDARITFRSFIITKVVVCVFVVVANKLRQEKVSDQRRYLLARYGIWLIFFHKSASYAQAHEQLNSGEKERRKQTNGKSAFKRKMMSIYLFRFVVCHSQFDVLYLSVFIWMSYTHTHGEWERWHINVNLHSHRAHPCTQRTVRFLTVNSNKHTIYINFLCHIFIHFVLRERASDWESGFECENINMPCAIVLIGLWCVGVRVAMARRKIAVRL